MKVIRVIARLNVGGPARHVVWLTRALSAYQVDTVLIAGTVPASEQSMEYFAAEHDVRPRYMRAMSRELNWRDGLVAWRLFRTLLAERPDVVHTHTAKAGAVGRAAAIAYNAVAALIPGRHRTAIAHTYHGHVFHGYYGPWRTRFFLAVERTLAHFTDRILVLSDRQRLEIQQQFRIGRPSQFQVVPLGIEVGALQEAMTDRAVARAAFGVPSHARVVAIVGRITAIKNHELFLESVANLVETGNPAEPPCALIVGDGDTRATAEAQVEALRLTDVVRFTGVQTSMASVYSAIDVLVLTSRNEGTPLAIIEAMVCGRPVVSTAVGGVPDLLGDQDTAANIDLDGVSVRERGILVTRADARSVAAAVRLVLDRPDLSRRMTTAARRYAEETFSVDRLARDIAAMYDDVAGTRAPGTRAPGTRAPGLRT